MPRFIYFKTTQMNKERRLILRSKLWLLEVKAKDKGHVYYDHVTELPKMFHIEALNCVSLIFVGLF